MAVFTRGTKQANKALRRVQCKNVKIDDARDRRWPARQRRRKKLMVITYDITRSGGDAIDTAGHQPATRPLDCKWEQVKDGQRRPGTEAGNSDCPE